MNFFGSLSELLKLETLLIDYFASWNYPFLIRNYGDSGMMMKVMIRDIKVITMPIYCYQKM